MCYNMVFLVWDHFQLILCLEQCFHLALTGDPAPHFIWCLKIYGAGPKSIQTPVPFRPPAGRNPDWWITMIFYATDNTAQDGQT